MKSSDIANAVRKHAKHKAHGGEVQNMDGCDECSHGYADGGEVKKSPKPPQPTPQPGPISKEEADKFRLGAKFYEGGEVEPEDDSVDLMNREEEGLEHFLSNPHDNDDYGDEDEEKKSRLQRIMERSLRRPR